MTAEEAKKAAKDYHERLVVTGELPNPVIDAWKGWEPEAREYQGFWFVDYCGADGYLGTQGVVVQPNGKCRLVFGAHGGLWNQLRQGAGLPSTTLRPDPGLPRTNERYLGSSTLGRYQAFARADILWEGGKALDTGFIRFGPDRVERECTIAATVIDVRDFTKFSNANSAERVQSVLNDLERVVQERFARYWKGELFVKGTGDGALLVSEKEWVSGDLLATVRETCTEVIRGWRGLRWYNTDHLKVGIGIDWGEGKRITIWGRPDYISPCINRAAKIQGVVSDGIAVSRKVNERLGLGLPLLKDERTDLEYAVLDVGPGSRGITM